MLIGNKYDLMEGDPLLRKVSEAEVGAFCNQHNLLYSEVSALTGFNVKESFVNLIESLIYKKLFGIYLFLYVEIHQET